MEKRGKNWGKKQTNQHNERATARLSENICDVSVETWARVFQWVSNFILFYCEKIHHTVFSSCFIYTLNFSHFSGAKFCFLLALNHEASTLCWVKKDLMAVSFSSNAIKRDFDGLNGVKKMKRAEMMLIMMIEDLLKHRKRNKNLKLDWRVERSKKFSSPDGKCLLHDMNYGV